LYTGQMAAHPRAAAPVDALSQFRWRSPSMALAAAFDGARRYRAFFGG
jgi:hypothetical protein